MINDKKIISRLKGVIRSGRRLIVMFVAICILSAFIPARLINTAHAATIITPSTGGSYTISKSGEYDLSNASVTNYTIAVATGVTATLNVPGTTTINNSGGVYQRSPISLAGTANLTINLQSTASRLNVYGSPGAAGVNSNTNANPGGYAGINVTNSATLSVRGKGSLYAYGGDAGDVNHYSNLPGNQSPQGGGGGGAGIGGNGGSGARAARTVSRGYAGGAGNTAGTIMILDTVKVYAYGGGGGRGAYAYGGSDSGASSGGGYPAAGIGVTETAEEAAAVSPAAAASQDVCSVKTETA